MSETNGTPPPRQRRPVRRCVDGTMRLLLVLLALACTDATAPALTARPNFVIDCTEQPEHPDCQPVPVITLGLWSCPLPYTSTLELHAYAVGADRITATATVALDPGSVVFTYTVDGDYLHPTLIFNGFVPSSVVWTVAAWALDSDPARGYRLEASGVLVVTP